MSEPSSSATGTGPAQPSYAPSPSAEARRNPTLPLSAPGGSALRLAGAVLIMNAILCLIWIPFVSSADPSFMRSPLPAIIDLLIGSTLVRGQLKYRGLALVRVVLGLLLIGGLSVAKSDWATVAGAALFGVAVLLLLIGTPGRRRIVTASVFYTLWFLLSMIGIGRELTGFNVLGGVVAPLSYSLEPGAVTEVTGQVRPWHLTLPGGELRLRRTDAAKHDNALADRWLVWPTRDVHVLVIAEPLPEGSTLRLSAYADAVLQNSRSAGSGFKVLANEPIAGRDDAVLIDSEITIDKMELAYTTGLFIDRDCAYQVVTWGERRHFERVRDTMRGIVKTFRPAAVAK